VLLLALLHVPISPVSPVLLKGSGTGFSGLSLVEGFRRLKLCHGLEEILGSPLRAAWRVYERLDTDDRNKMNGEYDQLQVIRLHLNTRTQDGKYITILFVLLAI